MLEGVSAVVLILDLLRNLCKVAHDVVDLADEFGALPEYDHEVVVLGKDAVLELLVLPASTFGLGAALLHLMWQNAKRVVRVVMQAVIIIVIIVIATAGLVICELRDAATVEGVQLLLLLLLLQLL